MADDKHDKGMAIRTQLWGEKGAKAGNDFLSGFDPDFGDAYMAMLAETLDKPALVTGDVEKILGRPARTFAQWVSEHRHMFTK